MTRSLAYLFSLIPPVRQISYSLRNSCVDTQSKARANRLSNSYFYNTIHEWNKLPSEIHASKSLADFKQKLITLIRPTKNPTYGVFDLKGIRKITTLCVQFSDLNAHRSHHNFDCISPLCNCSMANEDNEHYLLHCLRFNQSRKGLFDTVAEVFGSDIANLDSLTLCNLLLYGSYKLTSVEKR